VTLFAGPVKTLMLMSPVKGIKSLLVTTKNGRRYQMPLNRQEFRH